MPLSSVFISILVASKEELFMCLHGNRFCWFSVSFCVEKESSRVMQDGLELAR